MYKRQDMVRVDKNRFVANRLVNFSIDEIDTVLAGFITDNFRAIRDVTTFAMFPLCLLYTSFHKQGHCHPLLCCKIQNAPAISSIAGAGKRSQKYSCP